MSLYSEIGGDQGAAAAVDLFYRKILSDKSISHFFKDVDMSKQRQKKSAFLKTVLDNNLHGAQSYLNKTHKHLVKEKGLNKSHFNSVALCMQEALKDLNLSDNLIDIVMSRLQSFEGAILDL